MTSQCNVKLMRNNKFTLRIRNIVYKIWENNKELNGEFIYYYFLMILSVFLNF